jgi:hypothetical protein
MSIESDLRRLADELSEHRVKNALVLDRATFMVLNEASMQVHHIARELKRMAMGMVDGVREEEGRTDSPEDRRFMGERRKVTTAND